MRTVTLETETVTTANPAKAKKSKNKTTTAVASNDDYISDLIDDQSYIYSTAATNNRAEFGEWKTVKSKGSKVVKKGTEPIAAVAPEVVLRSAAGDGPKKGASLATNECGQPITTDPVKRLRNLRKKLKEIENLKQKPKATLEKEQLEKIQRELEIVEQIEVLARQIELL